MGKRLISGFFYSLSIFFTIIIAGVTIYGNYTWKVDPAESATAPIIGLLLPALILLNLFFFLYWFFCFRFWMLIPLVALAFNYSYFQSIYKPLFLERQEIKKQGNIKIATYNVHTFISESSAGYASKKVAFQLDKEDVDIICFQEFGVTSKKYTKDSLIHTFKLNWPYYFISEDNNVIPLAIFSKYPISDNELIIFDNSNNGALQCNVSTNKGELMILNCHFQTTQIYQLQKEIKKQSGKESVRNFTSKSDRNFGKRAQQIKLIKEKVNQSSSPILLCGDFNDIPSSYAYHSIEEILKDGFKSCGSGYAYSYRYFLNLFRIDYIFHSPSLQGIRYYSLDLDYSDHNPVLMELLME